MWRGRRINEILSRLYSGVSLTGDELVQSPEQVVDSPHHPEVGTLKYPGPGLRVLRQEETADG
jgi:hypothetical protein